jgi:hypothetical protein
MKPEDHPGWCAYVKLLDDEADAEIKLAAIRRKLARVRAQLNKEGLLNG